MKTGRIARNAEGKLWELLGVRRFQRGLFALERLRHRKDGGQNKNYHFAAPSPWEAERFRGYLLYHCLLHTLSILLLCPVTVVLALRHEGWSWFYPVILLLVLLNLWCIFLQRYNALRIRRLSAKQRAQLHRQAMREAEALSLPEKLDTAAVLAVLQKLRAALDEGDTVLLTQSDARALSGFGNIFPENRKTGFAEGAPVNWAQPLGKIRIPVQIHGNVQWLADGLQRRFTPKRRPMLHRCEVITENGEAEKIYRQLFFGLDRAGVLRRVIALEKGACRGEN